MPKMIRDFWPSFRRGAATRIVLSQIVITGILAAILILTDTLMVSSMLLWIILAVVFILGILRGIIILHFSSRPAKALLTAIIHVAGEPTDTVMPNPNNARYAHNGFKEALQTIYELSGKAADSTEPIVTNEPDPATTMLTTASIEAPVVTTPATNGSDVIKSALDATNCGFVVLNHDRTVSYANKAAPIHIDADNKTTLTLIFNGKDTLDSWLDECEQSAVHSDHIWTRIADRLPEEEGRRFFDVIASYDKGSSHETVLTLVDRTSTYDISEQDLDFIAFAAHELRGPITVIRGYLDVLEEELDGVLAPDQHELFRRLTVSANRLSGYINNILNTSRYDRRHLKVHLAEDTLAGIYDTIRDDMDLRAHAQNRLLSVTIPADLPTVAADRASISEVMGNLIDNAIKYSNDGGAINVTAAVKGDFVEVSVEDHGIGMPSNVVSNLFQKFYRSHRSRETVAGTGIGLYISKGIIESHGGNIAVRSEEGRGSTFTASLPIYATVAAKLATGDNSNEGLIEHGNGWIKNHSMYRG
jgi:signal transduction histidine kinase